MSARQEGRRERRKDEGRQERGKKGRKKGRRAGQAKASNLGGSNLSRKCGYSVPTMFQSVPQTIVL